MIRRLLRFRFRSRELCRHRETNAWQKYQMKREQKTKIEHKSNKGEKWRERESVRLHRIEGIRSTAIRTRQVCLLDSFYDTLMLSICETKHYKEFIFICLKFDICAVVSEIGNCSLCAHAQAHGEVIPDVVADVFPHLFVWEGLNCRGRLNSISQFRTRNESRIKINETNNNKIYFFSICVYLSIESPFRYVVRHVRVCVSDQT